MLDRVTRESFISSAGQTGAGVLVALVTLDTIPGLVLLYKEVWLMGGRGRQGWDGPGSAGGGVVWTLGITSH